MICMNKSNSIVIWDIQSNTKVGAMQKGSRRTRCACTTDLQVFAFYGDPINPVVELWDLLNNKTYSLEGHLSQVKCCKFSPDGRQLLTGGKDRQLILWDLSLILQGGQEGAHEGTQVGPPCGETLQLHKPKTSQVVVSPGKPSSDAAFHSVADAKPLQRRSQLPFPPDSKKPQLGVKEATSTTSSGPQPHISSHHAPSTVREAARIPLQDDPLTSSALLLEGGTLSVKEIIVGGTPSPTPPSRSPGVPASTPHRVKPPVCQHLVPWVRLGSHRAKVRCSCFSPTGALVASGSEQGEVIIWSTKAPRQQVAVLSHGKDSVTCCCFQDNEKVLVCGGRDGRLVVWQCDSQEGGAQDGGQVRNPDKGSLQGSGPDQGDVSPSLMDYWTQAASRDLPHHHGDNVKVLACDFSSRGTLLVSAGEDHRVIVWDLSNWVALLVLAEHTRPVRDCCFSPEGDKIAAVSDDGNLVIYTFIQQTGSPHLSSFKVLGKEEETSVMQLELTVSDPLLACSFVVGLPGLLPEPYASDGPVILCAQQSGGVAAWMPGRNDPVFPFTLGETIVCCNFDGHMLAVARRDGWVHITSCSVTGMSFSRKFDLQVVSISLHSESGQVFLCGGERKGQGGQMGSLYVWEYLGISYTASCPPSPNGTMTNVLRPGTAELPGTPSTFDMKGSVMFEDRENPVKIYSCSETQLTCCRCCPGDPTKLVCGSGQGWVLVQDLQADTLVRFNIHRCKVTACDFAQNGEQVVSADDAGQVVVWSARNGFRTQVLTLHHTAILCCSFNLEGSMVAVADKAGLVSAWESKTGAMLHAVQAHQGAAPSVCWSPSSPYQLACCGADGRATTITFDDLVYRSYSSGFLSLYNTCRKKNHHKLLEQTIRWHLAAGVIKDPSIPQMLMFQAAHDGHALYLSMLLDIFSTTPWEVHFGYMYAASSNWGPVMSKQASYRRLPGGDDQQSQPTLHTVSSLPSFKRLSDSGAPASPMHYPTIHPSLGRGSSAPGWGIATPVHPDQGTESLARASTDLGWPNFGGEVSRKSLSVGANLHSLPEEGPPAVHSPRTTGEALGFRRWSQSAVDIPVAVQEEGDHHIVFMRCFSPKYWIASLKSSIMSKNRLSCEEGETTELTSTERRKSQCRNLITIAIRSQHPDCVRVVVDALLQGRFSKASVVLHLYDALQVLIHDSRNRRLCRRLLKHLTLIENGEVEVESKLVAQAQVLYRCAGHGTSLGVWSSEHSPGTYFMEALSILIQKASWRDSVTAQLFQPVAFTVRFLWVLWSRWSRRMQGGGEKVLVSATSKLLPLEHAAEIREGKSLLRQLVMTNTDTDLYGCEVVRAVINVKWNTYARAFLLLQLAQYLCFLILFLVYVSFAVYQNNPSWSVQELLCQPSGQAAVVLECLLMVLMFGNATDEVKQMITYRGDYFLSPWNYMDLGLNVLMMTLFVLHLTRVNYQVFVTLVAMEVLLLSLRLLYFCMAYEHFGALVRMVMIVIRDMRFFFLLLIFLLFSFALTFSILLSNERRRPDAEAASATQSFATVENAILQLFTMMMGDVEYSTLYEILQLDTVVSKLAVTLACVYALLVLIVLVNMLIAIVDETYSSVKRSEQDQILRNKAMIIDEIESTLPRTCIDELNQRILLPYVHVLVPQQADIDNHGGGQQDVLSKIKKLKRTVTDAVDQHNTRQSREVQQAVKEALQQATEKQHKEVEALRNSLEAMQCDLREVTRKLDQLTMTLLTSESRGGPQGL